MVFKVPKRDLLTIAMIAWSVATLAALPQFDRVRGLSIDLLTWLRWKSFAPLHESATSPTVVVALDEETYRRKPFAGTPSITWTPAIARALTEVVDAGAKVVGFDIIFPTSLEQSEITVGTSTIGERLRGFDRDFLRALANAARQDKLVLGQVQHLHQPIQPFEAQRIAVGNYKNIRPLNLHADADGVVRRVPLSFDVAGIKTNSMAVELALRAVGADGLSSRYGSALLSESRVERSPLNTLTLNFAGGADAIPTYSLADLVACSESGNKEFFRREFRDRIVLFGALLDVEDRSVASNRLASGIEGARAPRCRLPYEPAENAFARDSVAGVYVHATAINNLVRGDALREPGRAARWLLILAASAVGAMLALRFSPLAGVIGLAMLAVAWTALATWTFQNSIALPLVESIPAAFLSLAAMVAFRFMVADSDKRLLRSSFSLYLPPPVIDRMLATNALPKLGGETRNVTVYFSDIAGFTKLAEGMNAVDLVALMNEYLSAMTDTIEAHGGFVDKYIGDAIVAVFGAPVDDPEHARNAVKAALACQAQLAIMNKSATATGPRAKTEIRQRIGLNTGETLVGNIGSRRRFNYTVMGDTVNLAARLESANKLYRTSIMASEATVRAAGSDLAWRELDTVTVVGRTVPTRIFEPLELHELPLKSGDYATYSEGLGRFRIGDFSAAAAAFALAATRDPPSAAFLERLKQAGNDPTVKLSAIRVLEEK